MDIRRTSSKARWRRPASIVGAISVFIALVVWLRVQPRVPEIDRSSLWIDAVQRGSMVRQVRGLGVLVPEDIRWVAARTSGRVENVLLFPGATVRPESVLMILANPEVEQAAVDADSHLAVAEAELTNLRVQLESAVLAAESRAASANADYEQAKLKAEVNEVLLREGAISSREVRLSQLSAAQTAKLRTIEEKRFAFSQASVAPQLAVKAAEVERARAHARLKHAELTALTVRAGTQGVLQSVAVEAGAQVQPGANLARVADPGRLKAEVRVAETQAREIQIGQTARIDLRSEVVTGRVIRVDPSVRNGTVSVDVAMEGALPKGARPDLSVEGTIEIERLDDILFVGRPATGQEGGTAWLFKLDADGSLASRLPVRLGRSSVNTIEILGGLEPGDRVVLSDMSRWELATRIRLN